MTVKKKVTVIPVRREATIYSTVGNVELRAEVREFGPTRVYDDFSGKKLIDLHADELDAMIELLHAVKNDAAEQAEVDVHTLEATA